MRVIIKENMCSYVHPQRYVEFTSVVSVALIAREDHWDIIQDVH